MAAKTEAYVDTSALIAFVDRSDSYHHLFRRAFADPPSLITTPLVISEGHAWFVRRFDSYRALEYVSMIESMTFLKLIAVGKKEMTAGAEILRRFSDQDLTLVDAVGLHLMSARRIRSCWSTDHHLSLTGVALLIHSTL
jgi:predicted nucleic acid-binding protein